MTQLIIYGAPGYTGRLASEHAKELGLDFIVAGRNKAKCAPLAAALRVPVRIFDVSDDDKQIDSQLAGVRVLLNCAGPFRDTAEPLVGACIRNGVHYLDAAAELISYKLATQRDEEAQAAGVMLLPGCGGSVAMLGCLAGFAVEAAKHPIVGIDIALHVSGIMSRGSAVSAAGSVTQNPLQRRHGQLVEYEDDAIDAAFDFDNGTGPVQCFPATLPDLITISKSTDVANIRAFVYVSGRAFPTGPLDDLPDGPTAEQRRATPYDASVHVTADDGSVTRAILHTVNGYSFTSMASVEAARLVLDGRVRPGFQTPAGLFGNTFVEAVGGSKMRVL